MTSQLSIQIVDPAGFGVGKGVCVGHVGFYIQNRGAIQEVHAAKVQRPAFDLGQFHRRKADGIGTMRGAGGQNAPLRSTPGRLDAAFPAFTPMKGEDEPKSLEAAQILKDFLVQPILKFQGSWGERSGFSAFHHCALMGCIDAPGIGGSQDADGAIGEIGVFGHVRKLNYKKATARSLSCCVK